VVSIWQTIFPETLRNIREGQYQNGCNSRAVRCCCCHCGASVIEFLLLAPPADKNIRKSDDVFIKQALFEFILSSNRKL